MCLSSFRSLAFVGFLLSNKDFFSCGFVFPWLTPRELDIWLLVGFGIQLLFLLDKIFIFVIRITLFRCLQESIKLVSNSYCTLMAYIFYLQRKTSHILFGCPVGWGCRIHWLHLCRGIRPRKWASWYDTKQSDGEVPVMLGLWRIRSTSSLSLLPGPLWSGVAAPDRALSLG